MLNRRDSVRLAKLLGRAERAVAEYAVDQSWRADAMHGIGERLLEMHHRSRHEDALEVVAALHEWEGLLSQRVDQHDSRPPRVLPSSQVG